MDTTTFKNSYQEYEFLNDYINEQLNFDKDNENNLRELEKFAIIFDSIKNNSKLELLQLLLESNQDLFKVLTKLITKNIELIEKDELNHLTFNEKLINLLNLYYQIYKTSIEAELNQEELDELFDEENSFADDYIEDPVRNYHIWINKPLLTKEATDKLFIKMANGDKNAKNILIERNLRLVASIAKRYRRYHQLSYLDLIQEGNIGLMKAIEKYDLSRGTMLSTYASDWIQRYIEIAIYNQSRTIRLPQDICEELRLIEKTKKNLSDQLHRDPTNEEIANFLGLSVEKIKKTISSEKFTISYNVLLEEEEQEEVEIMNVFPTLEMLPEEQIITEMLKQDVRELIANILDERKQQVLKLRYGIDCPYPMTQNEIGKELGITYQAVQKLEAQAMKKLILATQTKMLANYLDYPEQALKNLESQRKNIKAKKRKTKTKN